MRSFYCQLHSTYQRYVVLMSPVFLVGIETHRLLVSLPCISWRLFLTFPYGNLIKQNGKEVIITPENYIITILRKQNIISISISISIAMFHFYKSKPGEISVVFFPTSKIQFWHNIISQWKSASLRGW